ncbi:MAG: hypothetical protein LBF68_04645 [Christensenellaceae bacterium]|jgi:heme/copper-type cytochrome/quinol oxidase subunit 2|nr:hypothetical protein [Christensenellaceae bacterium]
MYDPKYPHPRPKTKKEFNQARDVLQQRYQSNNDTRDYRFAVTPETPRGEKLEEALAFRECFWTILIMIIPIIGFFATIYWALGGSNSNPVKRSKSNFAKAYFLVGIIVIIISVIILIIFWNTFQSLMTSLKN